VKLSRVLEEEGELKILSFSPLHLLAQTSFDYLCDQILAYLSNFHSKNPGEIGAHVDSIGVRFKLHPRIVSLALKQLTRAGKVNEYGGLISQIGFQVQLSPEEEELLKDLEKMSLKGELHSTSFEELKKRFRLSTKNLNRMLDFLVERKKIVKGRDGYIIHSSWLEELIQKLKNSGKRELSISEFKAMTGLSRKYAIPLLELLDQMGVTRRRGSGREIL
jgi:selenocysteine-specific elongation factor